MTPLETKANPNIWVRPFRRGGPSIFWSVHLDTTAASVEKYQLICPFFESILMINQKYFSNHYSIPIIVISYDYNFIFYLYFSL